MARVRLLSTGVRLYVWLLLTAAAALASWLAVRVVAGDLGATVGLAATGAVALVVLLFLVAIRWSARLSHEAP